jgi:hypothetical protein
MEWIFNPPTASWWGGFWERLVGLTKTLLRRILGNRVVALEELTTILCDVEGTLNQRPLTYLSENDPLVPLSPAFFLQDNTATGLPEADAADAKTLRRSASRVQHLREQLRSRFRKEYLAELKLPVKTRRVTAKPGDVVILESDNKKRVEWPWGIVKELYRSRDGEFRTALVKTKDGDSLRPLQRLYLLETALPEVATEKDDSIQEKAATRMPTENVTRAGRITKKPERLSYN